MLSLFLYRRTVLVRPLFFFCASVCLMVAIPTQAETPTSAAAQKPQVETAEEMNVPELTVAEREARELLRDLTIQRNSEIEIAVAAVHLQVEQLQVRLATTASPSEKIALQRATEAAKTASQVEVLKIQARYADLAGNPVLATKMREEAGQMEQLAADRNQAYRQ